MIMEKTTNVGGTYLQGYIRANYKQLLKAFGEPHGNDGYKTDFEWSFRFADGTVANIYNWKNGPNYCGSEGFAPENIHEWHVGGFNQKAVARVIDAIEK